MVNLALLLQPETFGFESTGPATRFGFILVGIWWAGFAQIPFKYLKDQPTGQKINLSVLSSGFNELKKVFVSLKDHYTTSRFLLSFFFFSMGVQTIIYLASLFGTEELQMEQDELIMVVLILQLVAIGGAYFFAYLSKIKGNGFAISTALIIWALISVIGSMVSDKTMFYSLAGLLGLVMGGIQSISRSTYSKLIPKETKDTASYFSFYDVTEKLAIVIGSFAYGYIAQLTGDMRSSMLFMSLFFVVGFIILQTAKLKKTLS